MDRKSNIYYNVKLVLEPSDYDKLRRAEVWIIGSGGIGRNLALSLASSAIGKIVLVDGDRVEARNIAIAGFEREDVGMLKVLSVKNAIQKRFGRRVRVLAIPRYTYQLEEAILEKPEIMIVGVDNVATRISIASLRTGAGKNTIFLGFGEFQGSYLYHVPGKTACWACLGRPKDLEDLSTVLERRRCPPPEKLNPSPILPGAVMKLIGVASSEVVKIITGKGSLLQYYCFDVMECWEIKKLMDASEYLKPDPECPVCNPLKSRDLKTMIDELRVGRTWASWE
ncbi:MAG: ThiF family adenylyltransferase [Thermoproteota archaeon]